MHKKDLGGRLDTLIFEVEFSWTGKNGELLGEDPITGHPVMLQEGRYGLFVELTHGVTGERLRSGSLEAEIYVYVYLIISLLHKRIYVIYKIIYMYSIRRTP